MPAKYSCIFLKLFTNTSSDGTKIRRQHRHRWCTGKIQYIQAFGLNSRTRSGIKVKNWIRNTVQENVTANLCGDEKMNKAVCSIFTGCRRTISTTHNENINNGCQGGFSTRLSRRIFTTEIKEDFPNSCQGGYSLYCQGRDTTAVKEEIQHDCFRGYSPRLAARIITKSVRECTPQLSGRRRSTISGRIFILNVREDIHYGCQGGRYLRCPKDVS